jgi:Fibrinogen beta and gamma chains, C-terminal globular domain
MISRRSSLRVTELFAGNDNIHWLTSNGKRYKLRIDLGDFNDNTRYAEYDNFKVGSACSNYILTSVGSYCGTAGNQLFRKMSEEKRKVSNMVLYYMLEVAWKKIPTR